MKKIRDYYDVEIPLDCSNDSKERFDLAVTSARERARLYVIPCNWTLVKDNGHIVRVCRERAR